nr:uncharacterized protein LOC113826316 [Penaeus vannamei]
MVKAEGKHKEKILQNEHTIIHKGTSSEHKHGFAGCPEGTQENKVTEQSELSRNHCNVEEIQREDIEVATGAKGGCGSARLSGDVVEAGETHRKGCVMGGAETKGDTEKLGEKKPNTEELTLYRKFMDREENADDRVISTKNDTGIEAISENKTEKGEFTEKEFERESERVAEVTDETDVTENKDDAAVVSENKNEAEEVAEDTNKTKDMKENENETEEVMKNSNRAEQVVENKIITESKAEAEQVAATQAEAEQVAATQAEAEQAAGNKLDRERENNNETDDIKEHKAAFGHPEIASDFKRGGSAVDGARPGPTSAPKKSSAADGTANVGGAGRKNKKKNSRRKK